MAFHSPKMMTVAILTKKYPNRVVLSYEIKGELNNNSDVYVFVADFY